MPRPEHLRRWCVVVGAAVWLCLALLGTGARASIPPMQEARAGLAPSMAAQGMSIASDKMPCALCFIAPTPST